MNDREKLTDIINNTDYVFSQKKSKFYEAYPSIAKLHVEVYEATMGLGSETREWVLTEENFRHAVNCSNSVCYGGGIEIGWFIHDMVRDKATDRELRQKCKGYEGSPKGRKRYRSCFHSFHIKAHIEYKEGDKKEEKKT